MKSRALITMALTLALAACGVEGGAGTTVDDDDGSTTTVDGGPGATTTSEPLTSTTDAEMSAGVHSFVSVLGTVLVDADGFMLYVFTSDNEGESTCYEACAELWPPLGGDTEVSLELDVTMFGTTTREDGSVQLTVNGMPLYRYAPDGSPGEANGQGFGGVWFVVDTDGSVIETDPLDYGY